MLSKIRNEEHDEMYIKIKCWFHLLLDCIQYLCKTSLLQQIGITRKRKIEELAPKIVWLYVADQSFLPGSDSAPENALSLAGMGRLYVSGPEDPY